MRIILVKLCLKQSLDKLVLMYSMIKKHKLVLKEDMLYRMQPSKRGIHNSV
jgi:hypothetical protein